MTFRCELPCGLPGKMCLHCGEEISEHQAIRELVAEAVNHEREECMEMARILCFTLPPFEIENTRDAGAKFAYNVMIMFIKARAARKEKG